MGPPSLLPVNLEPSVSVGAGQVQDFEVSLSASPDASGVCCSRHIGGPGLGLFLQGRLPRRLTLISQLLQPASEVAASLAFKA